MNRIKKIFKKNKDIVIGAIHFPPLLGYKNFPGFNIALGNALEDLKNFEEGEIDAVIFENNYDIPHEEIVNTEIIASMTYLGEKIKKAANIPIGISVLWNDYKTAFSIAKVLNLQFIRIPVFVDKIKTKDCGIITGNTKDVINFRKKIKAENIALFVDIHVKHSKILSKTNIIQSAKKSVRFGADGIIITGRSTAQAPSISELISVRKAVGKFPILIGSGADENNIKELFKYANGAIVSTSLKQGNLQREEVNMKKYEQRISLEKVKRFIKKTTGDDC